MITEKDLEEWFDSPVTQRFVKLLKERLEFTHKLRSEVFVPGKPHRTQEAKAHLLGCESELDEILEAFEKKDLEILETQEQEIAEPVRNPPVRRPGAH